MLVECLVLLRKLFFNQLSEQGYWLTADIYDAFFKASMIAFDQMHRIELEKKNVS